MAWTRLGPKLNSFLFSDEGTKYLRALLKYHFVINETLYSDAYYPEHGRHKDRDDHDDEDNNDDEDNDDDRKEQHRRHGRKSPPSRRHRNGRPHTEADSEQFEEDLEALYSHRDGKNRRRHHRRNNNRHQITDDDDNKDSHRRHGRPTHDTDQIPSTTWRVSLPTALKDRTVNVEVTRWMGLASMTVNSQARVSVQDGVARDGVVQVVDSVLMPPRHRRHDEGDDLEDRYEDDAMSVEELRKRLDRFVDEDRNRDEGRRHHEGGGRGGRRGDL